MGVKDIMILLETAVQPRKDPLKSHKVICRKTLAERDARDAAHQGAYNI
jgi:hypothetical protein